MKKITIIFTGMLFCFASTVYGQKIVNLGSLEYPPYTGKKLKKGGFITEIVRAAYKRVGYKVNIKYYPWARGMKMTKKGEHDGLAIIWEREERKAFILFSDPMPASEVVFYKRIKDKIDFDGKNFLALKSYQIGTGKDYANPEGLEAVRDQLKIKIVTNDKQNLAKLALGRIDIVITDKFVAQHILATQLPKYAQKLDWIEPSLSIEPNRIGISKKTPDAQRKLDDFNKGLAILKAEKGVEAILAKHGFKH